MKCPLKQAVVTILDTHTFQCELEEPDKQVTWCFNGKPIQMSDRVKTCSVCGEHTLEISGCREQEEGDYSVVVDGKTATSAKLTVDRKLYKLISGPSC